MGATRLNCNKRRRSKISSKETNEAQKKRDESTAGTFQFRRGNG